MTNPEVEVQIRNERVGVIFFIFSLFIAPVIAGIQSDVNFDIIRAFVLTQAGIVIVLYVLVLAEGATRLWRGAYAKTPVVRSLLKARMARVMASTIFVCEEIVSVADRLGNHTMNWRTPLLQAALLLLLYAWAYMDRNNFEEPSSPEVNRILDRSILNEIKRRA
jgi:hypothetical protein